MHTYEANRIFSSLEDRLASNQSTMIVDVRNGFYEYNSISCRARSSIRDVQKYYDNLIAVCIIVLNEFVL